MEKKLLIQLNLKYKELSKELGIKYIETGEVNNKEVENSNSIYPSSEEYKKIFQKILKEITIQ